MHLLVVTGFLGSGKTTLVVKLAQTVINRGRKAAIIVNEIGEIGIDGQLMQQLDLNVWEMYNGCICCTLAADLVPTLEKLDQEHSVDLVILEPSGVAEPANILRALPYYKGRALESVKTVSVLDALRTMALYEVLTPHITKQIETASLLLVNKADAALEEEIAKVRRLAAELNPEAKIVALSIRESLPTEILREVLPWRD
jgi:G3E family GTPase